MDTEKSRCCAGACAIIAFMALFVVTLIYAISIAADMVPVEEPIRYESTIYRNGGF